jgi:hypothetical protein
MINMALLKITAVIIFLGDLLKPIMEPLGKLFGAGLAVIGEFVKGFMKGFNDVAIKSGLIDKLADAFTRLAGILEKLKPLFNTIGEIIGSIFGTALKMILSNFNALFDIVDELMSKDKMLDKAVKIKDIFVKQAINNAKFVPEVIINSAGIIDTNIKKEQAKNTKPTKWNPVSKKYEDFIVTKSGQVIEPDPQDTIIGTKNPGGSKKITVGAITINLNVTEGGAKQAGSNFGKALIDVIKDEFNNKMILAGGRG